MKAFLFAVLATVIGVFLTVAAQAEPKYAWDISPSLKTQLHEDMGFLGSFKGQSASPFYKSIFSSNTLSGDVLMAFIETRIAKFGLDDCGDGKTTAACVKAGANDGTMWITPNYINFNIPQIYRISIIMHEARHTEADHSYWMHSRCPKHFVDDQGKEVVGIVSGLPMSGLWACDNGVYGSYGLQTIFLKNVANQCSNCSSKTVMDANLYGNDNLNRIIDPDSKKAMKADLGI